MPAANHRAGKTSTPPTPSIPVNKAGGMLKAKMPAALVKMPPAFAKFVKMPAAVVKMPGGKASAKAPGRIRKAGAVVKGPPSGKALAHSVPPVKAKAKERGPGSAMVPAMLGLPAPPPAKASKAASAAGPMITCQAEFVAF